MALNASTVPQPCCCSVVALTSDTVCPNIHTHYMRTPVLSTHTHTHTYTPHIQLRSWKPAFVTCIDSCMRYLPPHIHKPVLSTLHAHTCASFISRWNLLRRLATGAPLLKQGRPLSAMRDTVAMMGSATVRACSSSAEAVFTVTPSTKQAVCSTACKASGYVMRPCDNQVLDRSFSEQP
jgi:hypothetical protein